MVAAHAPPSATSCALPMARTRGCGHKDPAVTLLLCTVVIPSAHGLPSLASLPETCSHKEQQRNINSGVPVHSHLVQAAQDACLQCIQQPRLTACIHAFQSLWCTQQDGHLQAMVMHGERRPLSHVTTWVLSYSVASSAVQLKKVRPGAFLNNNRHCCAMPGSLTCELPSLLLHRVCTHRKKQYSTH